jgi:TonB family protein
LGTPIEAGWFVTGSIATSGSGSHADLSIPISGPKGSGTLHVVALKSPFSAESGDWKITVLEAKVDGRSDVITLNDGSGQPRVVMNDPGATESGRRSLPRESVGPEPVGSKSGQGVPGGVGEEPPAPPRPPADLHGPISGGVLNGKAIELPKPPYPATAKAVGAKGPVIVQVTVDENGRVLTAKAITGHPLLRAAAEAAAREARFTPTKLTGQAVQVSGVITYNFTQ